MCVTIRKMAETFSDNSSDCSAEQQISATSTSATSAFNKPQTGWLFCTSFFSLKSSFSLCTLTKISLITLLFVMPVLDGNVLQHVLLIYSSITVSILLLEVNLSSVLQVYKDLT